MPQNDQHVSTESQRLALEAMSAQLVHKLNAMIREQEERARIFASQHPNSISLPADIYQQMPAPCTPQPAARPAVPPPPAHLNQHAEAPAETAEPILKPQRRSAKKAESPEEGGNFGLMMIIFSILGIIMLLRSCS